MDRNWTRDRIADLKGMVAARLLPAEIAARLGGGLSSGMVTSRARLLGIAWPDERVALLRRLVADGRSAREIARELGGVSRNAVISKIHQLGLSGRSGLSARATRPRKPPAGPRPARAQPAPRVAAVTPSRRAALELTQGGQGAKGPAPIAVADNVIPFGQRRTLLELTEATCRWPIGDPGTADFFFCGGQTFEALSYCAYHATIAYQRSPRPDRQRVIGPWR